MRFPLAVRMAVVLGLCLLLLQGILGFSFDRALDNAKAQRIDSLTKAASSAVDYAVGIEIARQRDALETIADISRQQGSRVEVSRRAAGPEPAETEPKPIAPSEPTEKAAAEPTVKKRGFFSRLFGSREEPVEHEQEKATPEPPPVARKIVKREPSQIRMERLVDRVKGLAEYTDGYPIIWHKVSDEFPELSEELRGKARRLELSTIGRAHEIQCDAHDCVILGVVPFQTRDQVQIVAVEASSLRTLLRGIGMSAGYSLNLVLEAETDRTQSNTVQGRLLQAFQASGHIGSTYWYYDGEIAGIPIDREQIGVFLSEDIASSDLDGVRTQYFGIASVGVFVSLLLLALLLRSPIGRVGALRRALPGLTRGDFDATTRKLEAISSRTMIRDETTDLIEAAAEISSQLESMQKQREAQSAELQAEHDYVQTILDTAPASILVMNSAGEVVSANQKTADLLGLDLSELVGHDFLEHLQAEHRQQFRHAMMSASATETIVQYESELEGANGIRRRIRWRIVRMSHLSSLGRVLAFGVDITRLRESERRLAWLRSHDENTGLFSRRVFEERVRDLPGPRTLLLIRPAQETALLKMHEALGRDELQRRMAQCIQTISDVLADSETAVLDILQFAILIPANRMAVENCLESVLPEDRQWKFTVQGRPVEMELNLVGIEFSDSDCRVNVEDQLEALQQVAGAQAAPRTWVAAQTISDRQLNDYRYWVSEIDEAIREDRIAIFFQPVYDTRSLKPLHSEVLMRLICRDGSVRSAGEFVRAAERSGQLRKLERIVLAKAIDAVLEQQTAGSGHGLAVNISASSLEEPFLENMIHAAVNERGLDPKGLMLELLETQSIEHIQAAAKRMQALSALGIKILLDDFGIGFTSFEYLRELPFTYVKFDQSFVKHLASRKADQSLIKAMHDFERLALMGYRASGWHGPRPLSVMLRPRWAREPVDLSGPSRPEVAIPAGFAADENDACWMR